MGDMKQMMAGFCRWDVLALAVLIVTVVLTSLRRRWLKDKIRELQYELAGKYVEGIIDFDL